MGTPCFGGGDCGLDCAAEASKRLCSPAWWALCREGRFLVGGGSAWCYQAHGFPRLCREVLDAATPDSSPPTMVACPSPLGSPCWAWVESSSCSGELWSRSGSHPPHFLTLWR